MAKLISKTYGEALYELAMEEGKIDIYLEEVQGIKQILMDNSAFGELMKHPKIIKEEKMKVLENVFKGKISEEMLGFLTLIIGKDRFTELNAILTFFIDKVKTEKGIGVVYVKTAVLLSEIQKKQIEEKLLETTSFKEVEIYYTIDTKLIGGMVIRIGDRVVDSSIASKLNELQKQLLKIQLA